MSPHHGGIFVISIVLHIICIIPSTAPHHIHHSTLTDENSFSTNREDEDSVTRLPYFLKVPTTVTVIEGSTVILSCRIENLDDRMVIWIRNADLQILTAGHLTFTADTRFRVNHENGLDQTDWSLLINSVSMEDQGQYECQVNTEPKMKLNINLKVKEAPEVMEMDSPFSGAMIEGRNFNTLKRGSTITLSCKVMENEIEGNSENARRIDWLKNGKLVDDKTRHGGVSIVTVWLSNSGSSKLTLGTLHDDDTGSYSCTSNGFESEHVALHVVANIKSDAAEISATNNGSTQKSSILIMLLIVFINCRKVF